MKSERVALQAVLSALMITSLVVFSSCGGGGDPEPAVTKKEEVTALLVGKSWKIKSVSVDNVDKTSMFTGLIVTFTSTGFTVTNPDPIWPATGTWSFTNNDATFIKRNDNLEMEIAATATELNVTLNWNKTTLGPGRVGSVSGRHVFVFGR
jgi:hypothetical protein